MEIEIAEVNNIAQVKLRGRLDTQGADQIELKFTAFVVPAGKNTIVDLSDVGFVTSMGLRMFIGIAKALKRHSAKLVLYRAQPAVNEVFDAAHLADIVPIVPTREDALRAL